MYSPNVSSASRFHEKSSLSANPNLLILGPAVGKEKQFQNLLYGIIAKNNFIILRRKPWILSTTNP